MDMVSIATEEFGNLFKIRADSVTILCRAWTLTPISTNAWPKLSRKMVSPEIADPVRPVKTAVPKYAFKYTGIFMDKTACCSA